MIHTLRSALQVAAIERLTLLLNHVLGAERVATDRLRGHAGRAFSLQFDGWPAWLPALPQVAYRVTPAGLLEACTGAALPADPDLRLSIDAANPALALARWSAAGEWPRVDVSGDAQFAADLSWLMENLRWDVQDDLERIVGRAPAHELARIGRLIATGVRGALGAASAAAARAGATERAKP